MSDGKGLMTDILNHPEDDDLRLIYADWLCDHGQEDYGEFVRLQTSETKNIVRESELETEANFRKWFGSLLPEFTPYTWLGEERCWKLIIQGKGEFIKMRVCRGFIESMQCTLQTFHDYGPLLCQRQPIAKVKLTDHKPNRSNYTVYYYGSMNNARECADIGPPYFIPSSMMGIKSGSLLEHVTEAELNDLLSVRLISWARHGGLACDFAE